jgi:hypothetical protein
MADADFGSPVRYYFDQEMIWISYRFDGRQEFMRFEPRFDPTEYATHILMLETIPAPDPDYNAFEIYLENKNDPKEFVRIQIQEPKNGKGMLQGFMENMDCEIAIDLYRIDHKTCRLN